MEKTLRAAYANLRAAKAAYEEAKDLVDQAEKMADAGKISFEKWATMAETEVLRRGCRNRMTDAYMRRRYDDGATAYDTALGFTRLVVKG